MRHAVPLNKQTAVWVRPIDDAGVSRLRELPAFAVLAGRIAVAWVVSVTLPERFWRPLTQSITRALLWLRPGWKRAQLARLDRCMGAGDTSARLEILTDRIAFKREHRLHLLREYRPGGREHRVRLVGAEILHDALAAGNGAILWVAPFLFASLSTKIALHQAGFAVSHLSRPIHGFSASNLGIRWLNPIWTRVEERYLRERLVMSPGDQTQALRTLRARLADNQVVSITVGAQGAQVVTVRFLEADLRLATGPITLAAATGASLVPVFTVRGDTGEFVVELQPPLDVPIDGDRHQRSIQVAVEHVLRLKPFVRRHPEQWFVSRGNPM